MVQTRIITPKVAGGFVSRQFNLGVDSYDLDELYSPDTDQWKSKILHLGSPKYPPQVSTAPTRYWFDRSRYNNHGTITGATWERLPSGVWVMNFAGGDDYINCGNNSVLNFTSSDFSIFAWVRTTNLTADNMILDRGVANTDGYHFYISSGGELVIRTDQAGANQVSYSNTGIVVVNTWYLAGVTRSGATCKVYRSGVDVTTTSGTHINPATSTRNAFIGIYDDLTSSAFYGIIGEVFVYNRVLSAAEVTQLDQSTKWRYQ